MFRRKYSSPKYLRPEPAGRFRLDPFFLLLGSVLFWELFLHGILFQQFGSRVLFVAGYSLFFALLFALLSGCLPRAGNLAVLWVVQAVLYVWYAAQLIYYKIFGGFISVYLIQMGGDAITSFFKETVACVAANFGLLLVLEKAGKLEDTVIVMTADHFPYGLTQKQYNELADEPKDKAFGIYENAFICWSGDMEEPIEIDTPCCTVDILPTLLNLFGFTYDSRLLVGQDVLDPGVEHIAILYNGSFITDRVRFNSSNGEVTYLVDPSLVPEGYVEAVTQIVQNRFTVSTAILKNDYYRVVFQPSDS